MTSPNTVDRLVVTGSKFESVERVLLGEGFSELEEGIFLLGDIKVQLELLRPGAVIIEDTYHLRTSEVVSTYVKITSEKNNDLYQQILRTIKIAADYE